MSRERQPSAGTTTYTHRQTGALQLAARFSWLTTRVLFLRSCPTRVPSRSETIVSSSTAILNLPINFFLRSNHRLLDKFPPSPSFFLRVGTVGIHSLLVGPIALLRFSTALDMRVTASGASNGSLYNHSAPSTTCRNDSNNGRDTRASTNKSGI